MNNRTPRFMEDTLADTTWDTTHLSVTLTISSLPADSASMEVVQTFTALIPGLSSYAFNLSDASIVEMQLDGTSTSWTSSGDEVLVPLPTETSAGDTFSLHLAYKVPIRVNNPYGGGLIYDPDRDVLFSHGEPYFTRWWIACRDHPGDKVTTDLTVQLPSVYRVLSNGVLESDSMGTDGFRTVKWASYDPIATYLISVVTHPYVKVNAGPAGLNHTEVHYWVYPSGQVDQVYDFGRTPEMIETFEGLYGPFPFNKYDQAAAPIFGGGGAMENQTATTFGDHLVGDGTRHFEGIIAHELSHQWWGDCLTPKTFADIWLNEGFASYGEVLWAEHTDSLRPSDVLWSQQQAYFAEDAISRFPIYNPRDPDRLFSSTVYDKGSWILHMIRYQVGDSLFFAGLKRYAASYPYGNVETSDFEAAMETASAMDLLDFFTQWVYDAGYPIYDFSRFQVGGSEGGWWAEVQLNQTQMHAPIFTLPLPIQLSNDVQDTIVRVPVNEMVEQTLRFSSLSFRPTRLEFDPEGRILCRYNQSSIGGPSTISAFELEKNWPNPFNRQTRINIVLHRPGRIRVEIFNSLGKSVALLSDREYQPGSHSLIWNVDPRLSSGVYFLQARSNTRIKARKLVLVK